ncbi:MAG: esterase family protein, partial [Chlorobi bacterium]|nr:esterase family protein [Chlorobiota bacterium]
MRGTNYIVTILIGISFCLNTLYGQNIVHTSLYSAALDSTINVDIYLPPGYSTNPDTYYPFVIYMHGWAEDQGAVLNIANNAEQLINAGTIDPIVMVCADNSPAPFDGSMYMNSPVWGNFEDFMMDDLIPWVEGNYRVMPFRKYHGIIGESMGGYGALRYGIEQKTKFVAVAGHASPLGLDVIIDTLRQGVESENTGPPYFYSYNNSTGHFTKVIFLGAGAFSPNLNTPQTYIDPRVVEYPFDDSCKLIDTVFSKWMVQELSVRVKTLTTQDSVGLLFGIGTNDEMRFYKGNLAFKDTLDKIGIPYKYYEHSGGHAMPEAFQDLSLEFLDSLMLPPVVNPVYLCEAPSDLYVANINHTSADLGWTENGYATTWEIMLDTAGFDTLTGTPVSVSVNPFHWTGLNSGTDYDWYVRANCGSGDSSVWVGPVTFQTVCTPYIASYYEGFDNETVPELPNCWSSFTNDTIAFVRTVDSLSYSQNNAVIMHNNNDLNAWLLLISPEFSDLTAQDNRIRFMARTYQDTTTLIIGTMSNPSDTLAFTGYDTLTILPTYREYTIMFDTNYKLADTYIAFKHGMSDTALSVYLDNFSYEAIPCIPPVNQREDSITRTSARLLWTENGFAATWEIMVDTAGFDTTGYAAVTVTDTIYKATGLTSNT